MDVLVLLEEGPDPPAVLARVDSVPLDAERRARDMVTLYGIPTPESLALALAAVVESHRAAGNGAPAFRHLGIWAGRGAIGDAAWRDDATGALITRDLNIPIEVLADVAGRLRSEIGSLLQRLVAGLAMPDWPEGMWRAISFSIDAELTPATAMGPSGDRLLDVVREAEGLTYDYYDAEGD